MERRRNNEAIQALVHVASPHSLFAPPLLMRRAAQVMSPLAYTLHAKAWVNMPSPPRELIDMREDMASIAIAVREAILQGNRLAYSEHEIRELGFHASRLYDARTDHESKERGLRSTPRSRRTGAAL